MRGLALIALTACASALLAAQAPGHSPDEYLGWTAQQADAIGRQGYKKGRVGGVFDTRLLKTERFYNYKLAATWLTPDVIRAGVRLLQLRSRYSAAEARGMVAAAESAAETVVMVEIDPREGSGVIPLDWEAFLHPKGAPNRAVRGEHAQGLRDVPGLAGVLRRNYDYDRFWMTFPLAGDDGRPLFAERDVEAELVVRIHDKEGRVSWTIPPSIRQRNAGSTPGPESDLPGR